MTLPDINALAATVAARLPGVWRLDRLTPPDWRDSAEIFNTENRRERLSLSLNDWHAKGRLAIYGIKAAYKKRGFITLDPKKAPAQIAAAIARRCLPEYRAGLAELRETEASMANAEAARIARLNCLKAVCPSLHEARDYNRGGNMYVFDGGMIRENGYDSKLRFECNLPFDVAVKFLAFIEQQKEARPSDNPKEDQAAHDPGRDQSGEAAA